MGNSLSVMGELLAIIDREVKHNRLRLVCADLLADSRFGTCYGSLGEHHSYPGGLMQHTLEVIDYSLTAASGSLSTVVDREALAVAALYHDIGKVDDYVAVEGEALMKVAGTPHRYLVRHVAASYGRYLIAVDKMEGPNLNPGQHLNIQHCILAHHGRREWGSPVEPQTAEARILHSADNLSKHCGPSRYAATAPLA